MREIRTSGSVGAPGGDARGHPASETHPLDRRPPPARHLVDMVEFEQRARRALLPGFANERASTAIALPYRLSNRGRHVACAGLAPPGRERRLGRPELSLLDLLDERLQRAF